MALGTFCRVEKSPNPDLLQPFFSIETLIIPISFYHKSIRMYNVWPKTSTNSQLSCCTLHLSSIPLYLFKSKPVKPSNFQSIQLVIQQRIPAFPRITPRHRLEKPSTHLIAHTTTIIYTQSMVYIKTQWSVRSNFGQKPNDHDRLFILIEKQFLGQIKRISLKNNNTLQQSKWGRKWTWAAAGGEMKNGAKPLELLRDLRTVL